VWKQVVRARLRSALTVLGVATAMFLFVSIEALQSGVDHATVARADDATLVVYRENRFCPFTSRLPEYYEARLRKIPGVVDTMPVRVVVSNCRASLDVVTFRGVRADDFAQDEARRFTLTGGSIADWLHRSDAVLVGADLAARRGLSVGQRFSSAGVTASVAGIFTSDDPQDRNVAYSHLEFLQRAPGVQQVGVVTQFDVRVDDPARLEDVAAAIDREFKNDEEPTQTRSTHAFVAQAAGDVMELVGFTRWVAFACVAAVIALVANTIVLSVQERVRLYAVLQTLGYTGTRIGGLIMAEGLVVSTLGAVLGTGAALGFVAFGRLSISNEGLSIAFEAGPRVWAAAALVTVAVGVLAGLVPAWRASRLPIASTFRAV
jgi:putative ABC transport system permease protein